MAEQQSGGLSGLSSIFADLFRSLPYQIEGQWFFNQQVALDGYTFLRCRFENCTLFASRGLFILDHCLVTGCRIMFSDEALNVVRLWNLFLRPMSDNFHHSIHPVYHPDGTISVDRLER